MNYLNEVDHGFHIRLLPFSDKVIFCRAAFPMVAVMKNKHCMNIDEKQEMNAGGVPVSPGFERPHSIRQASSLVRTTELFQNGMKLFLF